MVERFIDSFFGVATFALFTTIYELIFGSAILITGNLIAISYSILCLYLGVKGIFQTTILIPNLQEYINVDVTENSQIKVQLDTEKQKNLETFSAEEISDLKLKLNELMNSKKLYRNAELNLNE